MAKVLLAVNEKEMLTKMKIIVIMTLIVLTCIVTYGSDPVVMTCEQWEGCGPAPLSCLYGGWKIMGCAWIICIGGGMLNCPSL